jgi:DNA-binding PadR family transcriptional regulator
MFFAPAASLPILSDMSEIGDKRRRSDLDFFVLALIEEGISTPYELKMAVGLSPGATIPALRRLLREKLVVQGNSGPRGRIGHEVTAEGRKRLKNCWRELIDQGPGGDLDAELRVALLALWVGKDRRSAVQFLHQAANQRHENLRQLEKPYKSPSVSLLALWYRRLRSTSAATLLKGEAAAVQAISRALPSGRGSGKSARRSKRKP